MFLVLRKPKGRYKAALHTIYAVIEAKTAAEAKRTAALMPIFRVDQRGEYSAIAAWPIGHGVSGYL